MHVFLHCLGLPGELIQCHIPVAFFFALALASLALATLAPATLALATLALASLALASLAPASWLWTSKLEQRLGHDVWASKRNPDLEISVRKNLSSWVAKSCCQVAWF